jgi:DNA-binding transcriptional LysR family regulator
MDFKQIDAFVNVAKYNSFSRAAEAIYLSQPTVSAHIASLEEELGTNLFDRRGKDVKLTHAGTLFLEYAINLINMRNTAILNISEIDKKISGRLTIASSTTPCRFILPFLVKTFHDLYKEVTYDIKEGSTKKVVDMILSGNSDIGIVGEIIPDPRLSYEKISNDSLTIISCDPALPDRLSFEELLKHDFIMREQGSATRHIFENSLKANGYNADRMKIFAVVSSLEAVLQFVKNGVGISIVSELACNDYIKAGLIRKHTLTGLEINRGIHIVTHNNRTLTPAARSFLQHALNNSKLRIEN